MKTVTFKNTAMTITKIFRIFLVMQLLEHRIQKCYWFLCTKKHLLHNKDNDITDAIEPLLCFNITKEVRTEMV